MSAYMVRVHDMWVLVVYKCVWCQVCVGGCAGGFVYVHEGVWSYVRVWVRGVQCVCVYGCV